MPELARFMQRVERNKGRVVGLGIASTTFKGKPEVHLAVRLAEPRKNALQAPLQELSGHVGSQPSRVPIRQQHPDGTRTHYILADKLNAAEVATLEARVRAEISARSLQPIGEKAIRDARKSWEKQKGGASPAAVPVSEREANWLRLEMGRLPDLSAPRDVFADLKHFTGAVPQARRLAAFVHQESRSMAPRPFVMDALLDLARTHLENHLGFENGDHRAALVKLAAGLEAIYVHTPQAVSSPKYREVRARLLMLTQAPRRSS